MEGPFVGRQAELALLRAALEEVRGGRSRLVLVDGPPGIGKTALLDRFLRENEATQVLRASGDESESMVSYAVVDQLLRVAGAAATVPAEDPSFGGTDHVAVGARILDLIGDMDGDAPVVLIVDDAHWADLASLRAVTFALRRLVADRVLALVNVRSEDLLGLPEGLRRLAESDGGTTLRLGPLDAAELHALGEGMGVRTLSARAAKRLRDHTGGNPLYARALLQELPGDVWRRSELALSAPRSFGAVVLRRLEGSPPPVRDLVEAAAVLGMRSSLEAAAAVAGAADFLAALEALETSTRAGLLQASDTPGAPIVTFGHPMVRAAVYEQLGPARRARLHLAAAGRMQDEAAALRHRAAGAPAADAALAAELEDFAVREAGRGAWESAWSSLVAASRLSTTRADEERRLLEAVDSILYSGDAVRAATFAEEIAGFAGGPLRDCVLGFLASMRPEPAEAERLFRSAWERCDPEQDPRLAATIARRTALHLLYRLRGPETVEWSRRALALSGADEAARAHAELLPLGIGLGYSGLLSEGLAAVDAALAAMESAPGKRGLSVRRARGWLRMVADDLPGALADLGQEAADAQRLGAPGTAALALAQSARAEYAAGAWDDAAVHAERGLAIAVELEHPMFRSLAGLPAVAVSAARGDWEAAQQRLDTAAPPPGDYEHSIAAASLARAHLAFAKADHAGVLDALEPILAITPREGIDEPGCWPWQDLYADALVSADRAEEADAFLAAHEARAAERGRRSMMAKLARVRGRVEAAQGRPEAADAAFRAGLEHLEHVEMPFERALLELAHGQSLRRRGPRRAAAEQLTAAAERFAALGAKPFRDRCDSELVACGMAPARRGDSDRDRLTPQELSVARLVASGLTNRQVAAELILSVRTVEFHLTRIYSKLGVKSRAQLAAQSAVAVGPTVSPGSSADTSGGGPAVPPSRRPRRVG